MGAASAPPAGPEGGGRAGAGAGGARRAAGAVGDWLGSALGRPLLWLAALPLRLAVVLLAVLSPGSARALRAEWDDRWWWGAFGLGASPAERRGFFWIKAQIWLLVGLPQRVLRLFDSKMRALGFTSDTWEAQRQLSLVPSVRRGLRELGMRSIMDWKYRPASISLQESRYTHPLLRPIVFLPGLEARPFYDSREFAWAREFESRHAEIQREFDNAVGAGGFANYLQPEAGNRTAEQWRTMFFVTPHGRRVEENIAKCPKTWAYLNSIPGFVPSNMCMFSALSPGGRIRPHTGLTNAALRVHLGVHVPEPAKAVLRCGDKVGSWEEGKLLIFNDGFDHEVWNFGTRTRVVLFFDVWHPDLTPEDMGVLEPAWGAMKESYGPIADDYERRARQNIEAAKGRKEWFVK